MTTTISKPNRTFRNASEEVIREAIRELLIVELPSQTVSSDDIYLNVEFDSIDLVINEIRLFGISRISLNLTNPYMHIYLNHVMASSILININDITKIKQF